MTSTSHSKVRMSSALLAVFLVLTASSALAQKQPESPKEPSVAASLPQAIGSPEQYVGVEKCKSCHKSETTEFLKTAHSQLKIPGKEFIQGCEACHGPGKAHSDAIQAAHGDDADTAKALKEHPMFAFRAYAEENASRCLACHTTSKAQAFFAHSEHEPPRRAMSSSSSATKGELQRVHW